ncbi:MAG: TlpA disulfide reductase family protein [Hyphomicrobiales bacterium]
MSKILLLFLVVSLSPLTMEAQSSDKIKVLKFDDLNTLLHKDNDTTYIINFWATWCKPCIEELPAFERINKEYANEKVKVLLVSLDFKSAIEKRVVPFVEKNNIQSEVIALNESNPNTYISKVSESWTGAIPATLIYNKNNRAFYEKSFTYEELKNTINSKLKTQ